MIIVRFTSGLGNQMYQYNMYSYLRERFPQVKVKADITWFDRFSEHQGFELLRIFPNIRDKFDIAADLDIYKCQGRFPNHFTGKKGEIWQYVLRIPHRLAMLLNGKVIREGQINQTGFEDNSGIYQQIRRIDPLKNYYITGFYIEEIYYRDRLLRLRDDLKFDEIPENEPGAEILQKIRNTESVSIHVRRGDYLSAQYSDSFISLSMDYYKAAIAEVKKYFDKPVFYIFSDDKEYIKKEFAFLDDAVIVEGNTGKQSFRDLQLMSECRINITANSTFSQWAGILNKNVDAKVIYPKTYMKQKDTEEKTLPGWIRV